MQLGFSENAKANQVRPPHSADAQSTVTFCQNDHDGRYLIGQDEWQFEIATSSAGSDSIYIYNDPANINGVAIAKGAASIADVADSSELNYTSRSRCLREGQIAVLRNSQGFYAALKILDVQDSSRGDASDSITIEYVILNNGGFDFTREK